MILLLAAVSPILAIEPNPRVVELQKGLNELGYKSGPEDGLVGSSTEKAIEEFQRDHGFEIDGKYSGLLLLSVKTAVEEVRRQNTPEGVAEEEERRRFLALNDDDLIAELEVAAPVEAGRIINLIGERALDLPVHVLMMSSGQEELAELANAIIIAALRSLYYPQTDEGIRQFQSDISANPSGVITYGEFNELTRRYIRSRDSQVTVPGFGDKLDIIASDDFVVVDGTWTLDGDDIAYPVNTSKISCLRYESECRVMQALLQVPSIDSKDESYYLMLDEGSYRVVSWTDSEVVARSSGTCRTVLLTINLNSSEVFELTRNNETKMCRESQLTLPSLDRPRIARLVPGYKLVSSWWASRKKITGQYVNPRHTSALETILRARQSSQTGAD
jgi:peptidoglycan hydrolase-like protein with peptidoglycan-binding domain